MSSIITPKQRERLLNRPGDESDEEILKDRRLNDFYVRKALKRWLGSIQDIDLALNTLPEKQIKKLFTDEDVFRFLGIAEKALVYLDFMPIQKYENQTVFAKKSLMGSIENGSPQVFSTERPATAQDIDRYNALRKHITRLETFTHTSPQSINEDLDLVYFRDLIKDAKKRGYEPTETWEYQGL